MGIGELKISSLFLGDLLGLDRKYKIVDCCKDYGHVTVFIYGDNIEDKSKLEAVISVDRDNKRVMKING